MSRAFHLEVLLEISWNYLKNCAKWLWFMRFDKNLDKKIPFHTIFSRLNSNDYTLVKRTEKTHKWNIIWREKKGIYQEKGNWWYNLIVGLFKNSHTHCGRALITAAPPPPPNRTGKNHDFLFFFPTLVKGVEQTLYCLNIDSSQLFDCTANRVQIFV